MKHRKAITLVAIVPNGEEIRGFVELIKSNGSVTTFVQAGGVVYKWDGLAFSEVGTVNHGSLSSGSIAWISTGPS